MRNAVLIITTIVLGILAMMIVMTINGRMNRSMELESNLSSVVEETLENMALNPKYDIQNTNAFIADFVETLSVSIDAESDVAVDILQCDKEKGILSVRVTLTYLHPNGNQASLTSEKHVILNRLEKEEKSRSCRVTFYVGDDIYKEYIVTEGTILAAPVPPLVRAEEGVFYGWIDGTGMEVDFTQPVQQDIVFYALIQ